MKIELIVIDSFGIGEMPDADKFGDKGSNTYLNTYKKTGVQLNNLAKLGLNNIDGINLSHDRVIGSYARLKELTFLFVENIPKLMFHKEMTKSLLPKSKNMH